MADQDRILVVCASRDRNMACERMIQTVLATSKRADIAIYVDDDQQGLYRHIKADRTRIHFGTRLMPVKSLNWLVKDSPGYLAYGAATDDCEFVSPGWDDWIIETARSFKAEIGVMCPQSNSTLRNRMDFPWATARWIETLGYFAYPVPTHYYWDVLIELLGEATQIAYAPVDRFVINHDQVEEQDGELYLVKAMYDARVMIPSIANDRPKLIKILREAIARG